MPGTIEVFRSEVEETLDALAVCPEREALVHRERRVTAGEFRDLVNRLARALHARGIERGQTVTLLTGSLPEAVAVRYAAHLLGCRVSHLYNRLPAEAQAAIVADIETRDLIVDPRLADRAAAVTAVSPVATVLTLGPAPGGSDLLAAAVDESPAPFQGRARPQDVRAIRHSGGTTGLPKGICLTYGLVRPFGPSMAGDGQEPPRVLMCTSLAHGGGLMTDKALREGGCAVLLDDTDCDAVGILAAIEAERISHLLISPPVLYALMDHPDADHTDTSSLRGLFYGGSQASPARLADAVRRFGPVLVQLYGQNETGIVSVLDGADHDPARPERLRSAGKLLPWAEVAIRDSEGRDLAAGEQGEVCIRSAHLMQGYWKQPELTARTLRDGWVHTGDLGFVDGDGYLTIVDRLKDMIITTGGHVYTSSLEDVLNSHPQVRQSAVYGVRDADGVEHVHAAVVPVPGSSVDGAELLALAGEVRGPMYEPARIDFLDALPLTEAGKPDKKLLRLRAQERMPAAAAAR